MTTTLTFYDANALIYRSEAPLAAPTDMASTVGPIVDKLIEDPAREAIVSDLVILEYRDVISRHCRDNHPEFKSFDVKWMEGCLTELMTLVDTGRVRVVNNRPQTANQASALVDLATRDHGLAFGVWDIMHIIAASAIGYERGRPVELVTADKGFTKFIDLYPQFGRFVTIYELVHSPATA